jgi:hypothetical protein
MMMFPIVSLGVFLALHMLAGGLFKSKSLFLIIALSAAAFGIAYAVLVPAGLVYAVCTHLFLLMLYLHFFVGVDRSVSVRVLNELWRAPGRKLTRAELDSRYPNGEMFAHRIRLMIAKGWVAENAGRLTVSAKSRLLVQPTRLLRKVYRLKGTW